MFDLQLQKGLLLLRDVASEASEFGGANLHETYQEVAHAGPDSAYKAGQYVIVRGNALRLVVINNEQLQLIEEDDVAVVLKPKRSGDGE